jgi:phage tail-like protein
MIFHDNDFLRRYLLIFETIWEPLEQRQDHIAMYFDPHTSPASFLPWLASWLGIELSSRLPEATRRALLAEGMALQRWRGTRYCLARVIEICAGVTPQIIEDPALPFVVRVIITAPTGTDVDRTLIEELIRAYKPAYLGYVLEIRQ